MAPIILDWDNSITKKQTMVSNHPGVDISRGSLEATRSQVSSLVSFWGFEC